MAKIVKNKKLSRPSAASKIKKPAISSFAKHAEQIAHKKLKNRQNKKDAVNRMMKQIKKNKLTATRLGNSKKKSKFDLDGEDFTNYKLTHKGKEVDQIDDFEQAEVASDLDMDEQYVENAHFGGFEDENNKNQTKHKTKKQVYEQIIAKSKLYKEAKQRQLQQNFQAAVQLDNQFPDFVHNLKFMDRKTKLQGQDRNYEKMLNQLKQQPKAVCEKLVKPDGKKEQNRKKMKRMQYIKQLEKQDQEQDIRGWIKGVNAQSQSEHDDLDDVNLSGDDQDEDQDQDQNEEEEDEDQDSEQGQDQDQDLDDEEEQDQQNGEE